MKISFHGAAREVTGSCHLIESNGRRVLLDCGMIQGGSERHERNRERFEFDPASLDLVVLSHAHIDHSGRLPVLRRFGYKGPILVTPPTAELCRILLTDSAHIQEEDARWKIKRLEKRGKDASWVKPLYTKEDAEALYKQLVPWNFDREYELEGFGRIRFVKAGHILGAAIIDMAVETPKGERRVTFSGDLGVEGARLIGPPKSVQRPDYLIMESTYGDRDREESGDRTEELFRIVDRTISRGGKVVIPAFAVGRTQEILARLNDLVESGRLSGIPVYVDSPMAINATRVFSGHPEAYSERARDLLAKGDEPLEFPGLALTRSVEDSKAINANSHPAVVISASGMCTAGRIKHHLRHNLGDHRSTILFVGYQAQGSLGRLIQAGLNPVRIFREYHTVRASIESVQGFSAHADRGELLSWFEGLGGAPKRTFVVHGEESASVTFAETLHARYGARAEAPRLHQTIELD